MVDIKTAVQLVLKNTDETLKACGLKVIYPKGAQKDDVPIISEGGSSAVLLKGEDLSVKIVFENDRLYLYSTVKDIEKAEAEDFNQLSVYLLELSREDCDVRDVKSAANDIAETLGKSFGVKEKVSENTAGSQPTGKKASKKTNTQSYDAEALAAKICTVIPELKEPMDENIERYGTFLAEDFFDSYGTAKIMEVIKNKENAKIKKLVNIFNLFYEEGPNDTQSLVTVTILGKGLLGDASLLERMDALMDEPLKKEVVQIIKYFSTSQGKKALKKMENPKPYVDKKRRK